MSTSSKKELTLTLRDQSTLSFSCSHLVTDAASLRIVEILPTDSEALLISFSHSLLNTQLDLSGASPYVALQFDENGLYQGASLSLGRSAGTFGIITQAKQILILPFNAAFPIEHIVQFQLHQTNG
ncbi:hypothetical protein ACFPIK_08875 [Algoriphagus aquatilis]|uniref:Cyclophilin-like domain-containing protein n=1 Tax=Algoriphagus aquatilis TaxID=490186 RepID=A0ABW0BXV7_9BACT